MARIVVVGGYARSLTLFRAPLLTQLVRRGHEVLATAAEEDPHVAAALRAMGVGFEAVPLARASLDPRRDVATVRHLVRRFRQLAPDAVFTYTIKPVIYGGLAARLARVPRRFAMITGLGYAFLGQERWQRRALATGVAALYRAGLGGAELVFLQNPDDRDELIRRGALSPRRRVELVRGSGVDVRAFAPAPLPDGPPVFLFVGRLLREKGVLDFVEMARLVRARHPEVRFRLVGSLDPNPTSVSAADVERWVSQGLVEYAGEVRDVRPELEAAHVIVLPSYREGTPRSVLEAMSMGRAAIVSDVPGCREVVVDGVTGARVPVRDAAALAATAEILIREPGRIARQGMEGRRRVLELYDAERVAAHMVDAMGL